MKLLLTATAALLTTVSAFAADLPSKKSANVAPVAAASSWTGFYAGLNAAYQFSQQSHNTRFDGTAATNYNGLNGFLAGGQIGADYQIDNFVVGVAGDYDKSMASKTWNPAANTTFKQTEDYVATIRGRAGYAFSSQLLAYATGGWAFNKGKSTWTQPGGSLSAGASMNGYVIGAGVEHKYTNNVSSFIEYRYYDFAKVSVPVFSVRAGSTSSGVRAGVNYRF